MTSIDAPTRTRSFIDLRAWVADATAADASGDAFLSARASLPLAGGPITVGLIALPAGTGRVDAMPADEFVIVESGAVEIEQDGRVIAMTEGDSIVLRGGAAFGWTASSESRLIYMRRTGGSAGDGTIIPIDIHAPLAPSGAPLAELLVGPTPSCRNFTDYKSEDGEYMAGTWDSTPYHRRPMTYGHYELMYLLDGSVTFVDGDGAEGTFSRGDIFLVEQGASCSWDSQVDVKKIYAIYRPV
ncbi:cupin domain-containing protein [Sphingobium sp.]|uniref:cupin domain-containing protein n=1 Tax=Sphingobium sp. TaxID=1912891 RepID=UPI003BB5EAF6